MKELLAKLELPSLFPRAICHHIPIATSFESLRGTGRYGLMLRTNLSHTWQYALGIAHEPNEKSTNAVLLGLHSWEVDEVLQAIRQTPRADMACPIALPCILVDRALGAMVKDVESRRQDLTKICQQISGIHGFPRQRMKPTTLDSSSGEDDEDDESRWEREELNLDESMKRLTGMSDVCAGVSAVCKMQYDFVKELSSLLSRWEHGPGGAASEAAIGRGAAQQLRFFEHFLVGIESKVLYIKNSVQGQVQTIYTLISQRESRSQMALAQTTRRLAELTQRDSTDMRIIAIVTLIFLPATFVSTFFSTTFFDFRPDNNDHAVTSHVSSWVWLYFVLATTLTTLILCMWCYISRHERLRTRATVRRHSKSKGQAAPASSSPTPALESNMELDEVGARVQVPRPYLSGSEVEIFNRRCTSDELTLQVRESANVCQLQYPYLPMVRVGSVHSIPLMYHQRRRG